MESQSVVSTPSFFHNLLMKSFDGLNSFKSNVEITMMSDKVEGFHFNMMINVHIQMFEEILDKNSGKDCINNSQLHNVMLAFMLPRGVFVDEHELEVS